MTGWPTSASWSTTTPSSAASDWPASASPSRAVTAPSARPTCAWASRPVAATSSSASRTGAAPSSSATVRPRGSAWTIGHFSSANGDWVGFTFDQPARSRTADVPAGALVAPVATQFSVVPIQHTQDNTTDDSATRYAPRSIPGPSAMASPRSPPTVERLVPPLPWSPNNLHVLPSLGEISKSPNSMAAITAAMLFAPPRACRPSGRSRRPQHGGCCAQSSTSTENHAMGVSSAAESSA